MHRGKRVREVFVNRVLAHQGIFVTEGDKYERDGENTIAAIKVKYVSLNVGWCWSTHSEVYFLSRETGLWVKDTLVTVTPLISE
jgi:hypothetical protein